MKSRKPLRRGSKGCSRKAVCVPLVVREPMRGDEIRFAVRAPEPVRRVVRDEVVVAGVRAPDAVRARPVSWVESLPLAAD